MGYPFVMMTYCRAPAVSVAVLGDELTLMEPVSGVYFGLDGPGVRIWELLETPQSVAALVGQLTTEFAIDTPTCEQHVEELLSTLEAKGLVLGVRAGAS